MKQTTNYSFNKPELADSPPDITVLNPNFDKIDTQLKSLTDKDTELNTAINQVKNDYLPKTGGNITNGLTVKNKTVAVSVNGSTADANGNIVIDVGGDVQSVNGVQPDSNGNVVLDLGGDVQSVDGVEPDGEGNVALNASTREEILEATERVTDVEVDASVAQIEALQTAVAQVEANLDSKLPLSGGTMTGDINTNGVIKRNIDNGINALMGGSSWENTGGYLQVYGKNHNELNGGFLLVACNGPTWIPLRGSVDGSLTWGGKNVVRSVNGTSADANGNVSFSAYPSLNTDATIELALGEWIATGNGLVIMEMHHNNWTSASLTLNGVMVGELNGYAPNATMYTIVKTGDRITMEQGSSSGSWRKFIPFN